MRGLCLFFLFAIVITAAGCRKPAFQPVDTQRDALRTALNMVRQLEPGKVKRSEIQKIGDALSSVAITDKELKHASSWIKRAVVAAIENRPKQYREYVSHADHRLTLYELASRPPASR